LRFNPDLLPASALLPNRDGHTMTRTNVAQRLALAVAAATPKMPSLCDRHISPHTIRHTTAMHLLQSGEPIEGIALWLGHESPTTTHQYTEANLAMKEKCVFRKSVTGDFGIVTDDFGNVTGDFGAVTDGHSGVS
jgi:site-specific recombinase XerD